MSHVTLQGTYGYTLAGYTQASDSTALVPMSEIGYFHFEANGTVTGGFRSSTAGGGDDGALTAFDGHYKFNGPQLGISGRTVPLGVISVHTQSDQENSYDYSFLIVDDSEAILASNGRAPQKGVLTGSMKRIHSSIMTPGATGSRK